MTGQELSTHFHNAKLAKLPPVSAGKVSKRFWQAFNQGETFSSSIPLAWDVQQNLRDLVSGVKVGQVGY